MKYYFVHNNGGRPYKIGKKGDTVYVYKQIENEGNEYDAPLEYTLAPVLIVIVKKMFVGKSPRNQQTEFSKRYGPQFNGNSILLKINETNYIYVGHTIYSFKSKSPIIKYVSPVGNSDVPYPYAIDKNGEYYLLIEDVILKNVPKAQKYNPYNYYYLHSLITADRGIVPPLQPVVPFFKGIDKFYIGKDRYTLRYKPDPSKGYDNNMSIVLQDGKKKVITKKEYIEIHRAFGKINEFRLLKTKKLKLK